MSDAAPIPVKRFDHLTLIIESIEASRRFYVDILGMEEVERPNFSFPGLWLQKDTVLIHLTVSDSDSGKAGWGDRGVGIVPRGHHFAFEVDDCLAAVEAAKAHNIEIASGPQVRPDGIKQLFIYDPDRHLVELYSN